MHRPIKRVTLIVGIAVLAAFIVFVPVVPSYGSIAFSSCSTSLAAKQCGQAYVHICATYNPAMLCEKLYLSVSYRLFGFGEVYDSGNGLFHGGYSWSPIRSP